MQTQYEQILEKIDEAKMATLAAGFRHARAEILYHMPDYPGIVQTYIHDEPADHFAMAANLTRRIDLVTRRAVSPIIRPEEADEVLRAMENLGRDLREHITKVNNTPDFKIIFNRLTPSQKLEAIDAVPLARMRNFLAFWHEKLDGPLYEVHVCMSELPPEELSARFNSATRTMNAVKPVPVKAPDLRFK